MSPYPEIAARDLEKYSAAATLSDMEIFVFPDLLYSLLLANIMSPRIWEWRRDPWFDKIEKLTPYRRVLRLKQFIIDRFEFNLDLDTWGLTTQERELARFAPFMDEGTISRSNALFGYEGDKYYFDLDIRRHFGLDKYNSNIIPYWKTETVEAMEAFRHKPGYTNGAGECVSLSTLYAAAMFIVCGIPLDKIFLLATPLHSQNFIDTHDGVLTNNRRLVTKNMWFNGTEITSKAQRALRHEQITIVAHHTGWMHVVYPQATIRPESYQHFQKKLRAFLVTDMNMEILLNYLRQNPQLHGCFQLEHNYQGKKRYIKAETVYQYERASSFKVSDHTRDKLLEEIDEDEFFAQMMDGRIPLNKFEEFFRSNHVDLEKPEDCARFAREFCCYNARATEVVEDIRRFCRLEPRWPDAGQAKEFIPGPVIDLEPSLGREEIIARLESLRATHPVADLAFYAWRDLSRTDWRPFLKAALERSPVTVAGAGKMSVEGVVQFLDGLQNESIYEGARVAQPDEVWNYQRGDGVEKALCLAAVLKARQPDLALALDITPDRAQLSAGPLQAAWPSSKGLRLKRMLNAEG